MYAPGDEQRVEARSRRAGDICFHAVADRQDPALVDRGAAGALRERQGPLVNRRMRLAGVDDRAAKLFIATGQRSGAIDERLTPMDDDVRDWRRS